MAQFHSTSKMLWSHTPEENPIISLPRFLVANLNSMCKGDSARRTHPLRYLERNSRSHCHESQGKEFHRRKPGLPCRWRVSEYITRNVLARYLSSLCIVRFYHICFAVTSSNADFHQTRRPRALHQHGVCYLHLGQSTRRSSHRKWHQSGNTALRWPE